jgi:hypothetical protein
MFNAYEISFLVRTYYDIQALRIQHEARSRRLEKMMGVPQAKDALLVGVPELEDAETTIRKRIDTETEEHPICVRFLRRVRGIGPVLSGGIIALIESRKQIQARLRNGETQWVTHPTLYPNEEAATERRELLLIEEYLTETRSGIACFDTAAKLWAYAGLAVIDGHRQKLEKGKQATFSPLLQVLAWKIGESFVKTGASYKALYDDYKKRLRLRQPDRPGEGDNAEKQGGKWSDGHLHAMSKRYVAKMLLKDCWVCWREMENLPVRKSYAEEYLGHTTPHTWKSMLDR